MNKFSPRDWYQKRGSEEMVEEEVAQEPVNEGAPTVNPGADRARNQQSDMTALLQQYGGNEGKATPDLADDFYRSLQVGNDFGIQAKDAAEEQAEVSGMYPGVEGLGKGSEIEFAASITNADSNRNTAFTENAIAALAQSAKTGAEVFDSVQPKIGTPTPGVEIPQVGGQPGNVVSEPDVLLQQHKGRVPSKLAQLLGGTEA
tara:strand:+ start:10849 stop:11454 length:606 start_codon:yes stop_codon:yes gene_type:complete